MLVPLRFAVLIVLFFAPQAPPIAPSISPSMMAR